MPGGSPGGIDTHTDRHRRLIRDQALLSQRECARTYLTAFASARECLVYSTDRYLEGGYYVYKAKLSARGYSTNDKISYRCYVGTQEVPLSTFQNPTDFETEIECRSNSGPLSSDIKVSVAGESCGTIPVGG